MKQYISNNIKGKKIHYLAFQFGLHQLINKPTGINDKASYCIHLIFASEPKLALHSAVHSSLHPNCYHQISKY